MKSVIFYTDCRIEEPIKSAVEKHILLSGLPITSVSLNQPVPFGNNFVLKGTRSYPMMVNQIVKALEEATTRYVFFCEHDVLYHQSHFLFTPPTDDLYYYNINNWRWDYPKDRLIRYEKLLSLSQMCCNRELALEHFKARQKRISEIPEQFITREPDRARKWGYEPGTKRTGNGGFSDEKFDVWHSEYPNIDIRHPRTFSPPKTTLESFKHLPNGWEETTLEVSGWDLKGLFK
jgi:hypothetical protein